MKKMLTFMKYAAKRCSKTAIILAGLLLCCLVAAVEADAADGKAVYDGNAREFIFEPGSQYSPTDFFPNFKDVMPGDVLTQKITVRNDASKKVKVNIYMRSLGAHEDSKAFLEKLGLKVEKSADNEMAYMFNAPADQTAQLTDWVLLGTLYSGGEVNLDVTLEVPVDLDNEFQSLIGYLDWEFMVEEFPVEEKDPEPPKTGDDTPMVLWMTVMALSFGMFLLLFYKRRKNAQKEG